MGIKRTVLMSGVTALSTGDAKLLKAAERTYQATVNGTGAVTATVVIEVSNDKQHWITLATIELTGTDTASDGAAAIAPWAYTRADLTVLTGTDAMVSVSAGS